MNCDHARALLHAELDGELDAAQSLALARHVRGCPGCAQLRAELANLQDSLRAELVAHPAPASLRRRLAPHPRAWPLPAAFVAGALAAGLAFLMLPGPAVPLEPLIASHLRALQPGHLLDVTASDRHNVKPWFDGRLDYAPPVKNLAAQGFVLAGGRLDYLDGRPVAVLVYRDRLHVIDLYVVPRAAGPAARAGAQGYNVVQWTQGGFSFTAVSDLNAVELAQFGVAWRADPG